MTKSYKERLNFVIPGGAHTYSRGGDQFPSNAPQILVHGSGAFVWDTDEKKYLDYGMALRSVTLGYAQSDVNAAAIRAIQMGNNLTLPTTIELAAAERLIELIPSFEMVKFAKNGSNTTTAAVKLARAFTNRRFICIPRQHPFFSFDDWFIGTTDMKRGVDQFNSSSTLLFDYGDITSLKNIFDSHPEDIAGVMLEPATHITPCSANCENNLNFETPCNHCKNNSSNFLKQVQNLCRSEGALFILDEMITGFRWDLGGAQSFFGVEPDLSTFGKGMANGFSVAVIGGRRDVMSVGSILPEGQERTFLMSTTHGSEMSSLAAFLETSRIYEEFDVCSHLWNYGRNLRHTLKSCAEDSGMDEYFDLLGPDINLVYLLRDLDGNPSLPLKTLFNQEMIKNGVIMPWISISYAHGKKELELTAEAAFKSLKTCKLAIENGIEKYLNGPAIKPIFRKYN